MVNDKDWADYQWSKSTGVPIGGVMGDLGAQHSPHNRPGPATGGAAAPAGPSKPMLIDVTEIGDGAPMWKRVASGALLAQALMVPGMVASGAAGHRLTLLVAVVAGLAGLAIGYVQTGAVAETAWMAAGVGFVAPYVLLIAVIAVSALLVALVNLTATLVVVAVKLALGAAVIYGAWLVIDRVLLAPPI